MIKLRKIVGEEPCGVGTCPAILLSEDGRLYIQGHRVHDDVRAALSLQESEDAVEIPLGLLERAVASLHARRDEDQTRGPRD